MTRIVEEINTYIVIFPYADADETFSGWLKVDAPTKTLAEDWVDENWETPAVRMQMGFEHGHDFDLTGRPFAVPVGVVAVMPSMNSRYQNKMNPDTARENVERELRCPIAFMVMNEHTGGVYVEVDVTHAYNARVSDPDVVEATKRGLGSCFKDIIVNIE